MKRFLFLFVFIFFSLYNFCSGHDNANAFGFALKVPMSEVKTLKILML